VIADNPAAVSVLFNAVSSIVVNVVYRAMTREPCARAAAIAFNCTVVGRISAPCSTFINPPSAALAPDNVSRLCCGVSRIHRLIVSGARACKSSVVGSCIVL